MAGLKSTMVVLVMMMAASFQLQFTVAKTSHVVGDVLGWTIPPGGEVIYATWASRRNFTVGDTLVFNFPTGLHTVAEVPKAAYGPCNYTNTLSNYPNGPATITLTRPGNHYYICTVLGHCQLGQKITINVTSSTSTTRPRSPYAASPSPFDQYSPIGSPIPSFSGTAQSFTTMIPAVTFLAAVFAFLY
uniref:mavicyanin-like n=1 Tax=Erigeron canadensis TaxID=72917 RepID=UPI001CB8ED4B|nr:mavicyanin-like [Erigeron canadensis]